MGKFVKFVKCVHDKREPVLFVAQSGPVDSSCSTCCSKDFKHNISLCYIVIFSYRLYIMFRCLESSIQFKLLDIMSCVADVVC